MAISWSYVRSTFDFCGKKDVIPPFLKKTQLFVLRIFLSFASFFSFKETQFLFIHIILFIHPVICPPVIHLVVISPVIHQVIWCFPILLTTSLSYPMAIFSANEIRTFLTGYYSFDSFNIFLVFLNPNSNCLDISIIIFPSKNIGIRWHFVQYSICIRKKLLGQSQ